MYSTVKSSFTWSQSWLSIMLMRICNTIFCCYSKDVFKLLNISMIDKQQSGNFIILLFFFFLAENLIT
jgi:hypothetical protein